VTASELAHDLLDGVRKLHDEWALVAGRLSDADLRAPSALPGWTRAHLLTHFARNADGLRNLLAWARTGVETPMYASAQARDDDIEAGARRAAPEIIADVLASSAKFTELAEAMPVEAWSAEVRNRQGNAVSGAIVIRMRLSEAAIHLADLDAGYDFARVTELLGPRVGQVVEHALSRGGGDLPVLRLVGIAADGTRYEWKMGTGDGAVVTGGCGDILAWATGRADGSTLDGDVPQLPPWT
jgi:maleylpyruvate isomerase